jgi:hypothetical protein
LKELKNLEKISQNKNRKKLKDIVKEIPPSKPNFPSKQLLTQLQSIQIPKSLLSANIKSQNQSNSTSMKPQFDVRQKSLLGSSFNRSIGKIDNEDEKKKFIEKSNKKKEKELDIEAVQGTIKKVDERLSEESITSNTVSKNPLLSHLYDGTVVNKLKFSKPSDRISLGDLFNQSVDEKVKLSPKDPLKYVSSVLGRSFNTFIPNLDRYKPIKSYQDILRERGNGKDIQY